MNEYALLDIIYLQVVLQQVNAHTIFRLTSRFKWPWVEGCIEKKSLFRTILTNNIQDNYSKRDYILLNEKTKTRISIKKKKRIKKTGVFNLMDVCHGSQVIRTCAVKVCPSQEMEED